MFLVVAADAEHGIFFVIWLIEMVYEEALVEGRIVVKIVAAGCRAAIEGQALVGLAFVENGLVAIEAVVVRKRYAHFQSRIWAMLDVTSDASGSLNIFKRRRISWVLKFDDRVGVIYAFELFLVTLGACVLFYPHVWRMTGHAGELDLVVPVAHVTGRDESGGLLIERIGEDSGEGYRSHYPDVPKF